jgi:hypothetical protein
MDIKIQESDLKRGSINRKKSPTKMYVTCTQYQEFPPEVFSNHYFREDIAAQEEVYWQKKRNDKRRKKAVAKQNKNDKSN